MSNDYDDHTVSDIVDKDVSRAYRDVATERAPASLNERVLRDARSHAKGDYSHAVRWLRPLAWAATVALSLGIVIQLTTLPGIEPPAPPLGESALETDAAGRLDEIAVEKPDRRVAPAAAAPVEETQESAAPAGGGGIASSDAFAITDAPMLEQARDMAAEQTAIEREAGAAVAATAKEERQGERLAPESAVESGDAAVSRAAEAAVELDDAAAASRQPDADAPTRARQMLRESAFVSTAAVEDPAADESSCDETARTTPETWLECIEDLRRDGRDDDADAEEQRLTETFPGFVIR